MRLTSSLKPGYCQPKVLGRPILTPLKLKLLSMSTLHETGSASSPLPSVVPFDRTMLSSKMRSSMLRAIEPVRARQPCPKPANAGKTRGG